jgi:hypothetical protein
MMQLENARNEAHFAQENNKDYIDEQKEKKSLEYESKIKEIKEATGLSSISEVLNKIEGQQGTREHLEKLRDENEDKLKEMKAELKEIEISYEEMKFNSSHAKESHNQALEDELQQHLTRAQEHMRKEQVNNVNATR